MYTESEPADHSSLPLADAPSAGSARLGILARAAADDDLYAVLDSYAELDELLDTWCAAADAANAASARSDR